LILRLLEHSKHLHHLFLRKVASGVRLHLAHHCSQVLIGALSCLGMVRLGVTSSIEPFSADIFRIVSRVVMKGAIVNV
jgi:hypothetical protein